MRAVVFDLGEVLAPAWDLRPLAHSVGADPEAFAAAYWAHRGPYDCGGPPEQYWSQVLRTALDDQRVAEPGGVGRRVVDQAVVDQAVVDQAVIDRLTHEDAVRWAELAADSEPLLAELRAAAVPLALLSNAPRPLAEVVRAQAWARHFDVLVFSAELGRAKPDPAAYQAVGSGLRLPPSDLVFFDDRQVNVDAALAAGWQAHRWQGVAAARIALADLLG